MNVRWLGGTLTNWQTIKQRIDFLDKLESRRDAGDFDLLKKTERLRIERDIAKLDLRLGWHPQNEKCPHAAYLSLT